MWETPKANDICNLNGFTTVNHIDAVIMGHVITRGCGQATAPKAAPRTGIPFNVPTDSVTKVCATRVKEIFLGASSI